jgi:hypothetical protein
MYNKKWLFVLILVIIMFGLVSYIDLHPPGMNLMPIIYDKGIAMAYPPIQESLDGVGANWYYTWTSCNVPNCVPMSWGGEDLNLPLDYSGYILLFNEPDRPEQSNITPENGVAIYKQFKLKYPYAKWVVGNVWYAQWLYTFRDLCAADPECEVPTIWGLHAYVGYIEYLPKITKYLEDAHNNLGGIFWITEFAGVFGDIRIDEGLVRFFESHNWIERWAYFTNRAQETETWYPSGWDVQLYDWNTGELTKIGNWYAYRLKEVFLPMVSK